ncbi:MAG: hypothetical protein R3D28_12485 [Geminicoccaceae bacterium]
MTRARTAAPGVHGRGRRLDASSLLNARGSRLQAAGIRRWLASGQRQLDRLGDFVAGSECRGRIGRPTPCQNGAHRRRQLLDPLHPAEHQGERLSETLEIMLSPVRCRCPRCCRGMDLVRPHALPGRQGIGETHGATDEEHGQRFDASVHLAAGVQPVEQPGDLGRQSSRLTPRQWPVALQSGR